MAQLIQLIKAVKHYQDATTPRFIYVTFPALTKSGPCEQCLTNETQQPYTETEILNEFIYAELVGDVWEPNVHNNCVCKMFPYDTEEGPKLSDKEFDDWLTGLLSLGYITTVMFNEIVERRRKKKELSNEK